MNEEILHIGMDLGSFKTSVTSSSGRREVLQSAIGRPKDQIARALLGREVVFGSDIRDKRLSLDVVRPFEKGALKYNDMEQCGLSQDNADVHKEAAKLLVKHAVSLMQPASGARIYGVIGAPSRANAMNKQVLLEAAGGAFHAVAIVPEPFTVAYGMDRLCDTLVVDIGAGTIDICPLHGTFPSEESQVTIPMGGDAVDDKFYQLIKEAYPEVRLSEHMVRDIKEKHGFVHDANERVQVKLPTEGQPRTFDVTDQLRDACRTMLPPIVDGLRQVISSYDPEFQQSLLSNILLGGGGSQLKGLDRLLEEALQDYGGANVTKVYDSVFAGATGALKLAMDMPAEYWAQMELQSPTPAAA